MDPKKIKKLVKDNYPVRATLGFPKFVQKVVATAATELRAAGKSDADIGKMFGLSEHSIMRWRKVVEEYDEHAKESSKDPTNGHRPFQGGVGGEIRMGTAPIPAVKPNLRALIRYEIQGVTLGVKSRDEAWDRIFALVEGE